MDSQVGETVVAERSSVRTTSNAVHFSIDGPNIFPRIIELIESARESVFVEVYLFYDDESGRAIAAKLAEKARAGLDVRVLVSDKALEFNRSFGVFRTLKESGAKVILTFPLPEAVKDVWHAIDCIERQPHGGGAKDGGGELECRYDSTVDRGANAERAGQSMQDALTSEPDQQYFAASRRTWRRKKVCRSVTFYDHRKLIVVDGRIAFLGGMNFGNDYLFQGPPSELGYYHDIGVRLEGEAVKDVLKLFMRVWYFFDPGDARLRLPAVTPEGRRRGVEVTTLSSFPGEERNEIRESYLRQIREAQRSIALVNLFITDSGILDELVKARQRGVEVVLISTFLPTRAIESQFTRILYRGYYYLICCRARLQEHGIELRHYTKLNIHAKVGIIDGRWLTVGSSNLDYSSLRNAMEVNLVMSDPQLVARLQADLVCRDVKESEALDTSPGLLRRLWYSVCYGIFTLGEKYFL